MLSDQQRAEIADAAVRKARSNRRLRQEYGLGIFGWITLGISVIRLLWDIFKMIRDREAIESQFATGRMKAYSMLVEQGHDADLARVVQDAEFEVLGK